MQQVYIVFILAFFPLTLIAQIDGYTRENDLYYFSEDSVATDYQKEKCLLDIYYPKTNENVPVIMWFHGGGLTSGAREIPERLKNQGFVIIGVGYRLAGSEIQAEVSISDAAAAVAWVIKNIEKYRGDPDAVFVSGHSAGGYLALMTVMNKTLLLNHGIDANNIAGVVPFSGHTITHFSIRSERGIPGEQPIIDEFAPLYYVRKEAPPMLLITGDRELEILGRYEENAYFYRMMKVSGHQDIKLNEMEGYGHNMAEPAYPLLLNFVRSHSEIKN